MRAILALCIIIAVIAATTTTASVAAQPQPQQYIKQIQHKAQTWFQQQTQQPITAASIATTKYVAQTLQLLQTPVKLDCNAIVKLINQQQVEDMETIFHLLQTAQVAKCALDKVSKNVVTVVASNFNDVAFVTVHQAMMSALTLLQAASPAPAASWTTFEWNTPINRAIERLEDDAISPLSAAVQFSLAFEIFAAVGQHQDAMKINARKMETIRNVVSKADDILLFVGEDDVFIPSKTKSSLAVNAHAFAALNQLATVFPQAFTLPANQTTIWQDFFLSHVHSTPNADDLYHETLGLVTCASNQFSVVPVVTLTMTEKAAEGQSASTFLKVIANARPLQVKITDATGKAIKEISQVSVSSVVVENGNSNLLNAPVVLSQDATVFSASWSQLLNNQKTVNTGFYSVVFQVTSGPSTFSFSRSIKFVQKKVSGQDVGVAVSDEAKSSSATFSRAKFPQSVDSILFATGAQYIHVTFSLAGSFKPSQVALTLSFEGDADVAPLILTPKRSEENSFSVSIDLGSKDHVKRLSNVGHYKLTVVAGDALLLEPLEWKLATVHIDVSTLFSTLFPANPKATINKPAPPARSYYGSALPEIAHIFRAADVRPPRSLALLFTGAIVFLLFALFPILSMMGVQLHIPSASRLVGSLAFLVIVAAMLIVITIFWLGWLPLSQILLALTVLSISSLFAARSAFVGADSSSSQGVKKSQ